MIIKDFCVCKENKKTEFKTYITYKNESVFKDYEGISIYKCLNCGVLKTFPDKDVSLKQESRFEYYEKHKKEFIEIFKPIVKKIKKYKKNGLVLDVGCSSGILLEMLNKYGYEVYGLEPDKKAYFKAKMKFENKIFNNNLLGFLRTNRLKFDIIIYNHVLEHIPDPLLELKFIKKVLKNDGILVLGLPNTSNLIFWLRKKYWENLMPKEHIWHFSKKQLVRLLKKEDFMITEINFSYDKKKDYPLLKRIYFRLLNMINKLIYSGESMLIICKRV